MACYTLITLHNKMKFCTSYLLKKSLIENFIFCAVIWTCINWNSHWQLFLEKNAPKILKHKVRWVIYRWWWKYAKASIIRFFTITHARGCMDVLLNRWEILFKELFFNKISALQPANAIKTKFLQNSFQGFCVIFGNN